LTRAFGGNPVFVRTVFVLCWLIIVGGVLAAVLAATLNV
jgi:hypothetical protein